MRCPFCGTSLKDGPLREYETLADHVSNPNAESYSLRLTFTCGCAQSEKVFWDWHGDVYVYAGGGDWGTKDAIGSSAHRFCVKQKIAGRVRPFCRGEYPYDESWRIARRWIKLVWPIQLAWSTLAALKKRRYEVQ